MVLFPVVTGHRASAINYGVKAQLFKMCTEERSREL